MPSFNEWVRAVLGVKAHAEKHRDPLLLPIVNILEQVGEEFKDEPEYRGVITLLEEVRGLITNGGGLLRTVVKRRHVIYIPTSLVRRLGLVPGDAMVRMMIGGEVVEFRARLVKTNRRSGTLRFHIPHDVYMRYQVREGQVVTILAVHGLLIN